MNIRLLNFIHENKVLSFSFIFFALFSTSLHVFATPPSSPYGAGDTLDPSCAPGDTYCYVGGVSFFNYGNNGSVTTDGRNTFLGINAGNRTLGETATLTVHSSRNAAFGYGAAQSLTTGSDVVAIGNDALNSLTTGYYTVAVGSEAGKNMTTGNRSVFVGYQAAKSMLTGIYNHAIGYYSLGNATEGDFNIAIGPIALANNSGDYNHAIGWDSLGYITTGDRNIAIGANSGSKINAGSNLTSASNSIFLGYDTRANAVSESNQIVIGYTAQGLGSNTTVIGNSSTTLTHLKGKLAIGGATSSSYQLHVGTSSVSGIVARFQNSTGTCDINPTTTSLSCSSDETLKTNIETLELDALDIINELRPVTYNWKTQADQETIPGFIAQEIETLLPKLVNTDPQTNLKSLNYTLFTPYIIKSIQELDEKVTTLTTSQHFFDTISTWLASATNGINQIFVKKIRTEQICVKKSDGSEFCVTGDQLESAVSSGGVVYSYAVHNDEEEETQEEEIIDEETPSEDTLTEEEEVIEETPEEVIEEEEDITDDEEVITEDETLDETQEEDISEEETL